MSEKVSVLVGGKRFEAWEDININLSLDSIDTFSFGTAMIADNPEFRERFRPFNYASTEIRLNDETVLSGFLVNKSTSLNDKNLGLGGYSKPGVLKDLPVPPDKYPLELTNQTLPQIAGTLAGYYGIKALFSSPAGGPFAEGVSPEPSEKVLEFLIKLAQKREMLVSNTVAGDLDFFIPGKSDSINPLRQGELPLLDVQAEYTEQEMFSSVTGLGSADWGRDPESFTFPIPALKSVNRPFVYTVSDAKGSELQKAVQFKAGRVFAAAVSLSASVIGWRGLNGKIWAPGDFVSLHAPNNFIYNETKLLIRTVGLRKTSSDDTANLGLTFPGVFSGELPTKMPWG